MGNKDITDFNEARLKAAVIKVDEKNQEIEDKFGGI